MQAGGRRFDPDHLHQIFWCGGSGFGSVRRGEEVGFGTVSGITRVVGGSGRCAVRRDCGLAFGSVRGRAVGLLKV